MLIVLLFFNKRMKAGFRESRKTVGELNSQVEDSLLGMRVVKSFANEEKEIEKFERGNKTFLKVKTKVYHYMAGFQSSTRFFEGFMYIVIIVAGALFLINGKIDVSVLIAYLLYVSTLLASIRKIVEFAEQFQRGMTGIERFAEIMDTEPDIKAFPSTFIVIVPLPREIKDRVAFPSSFVIPGTDIVKSRDKVEVNDSPYSSRPELFTDTNSSSCKT